MSKISKILIANRGEIALRVMRTAREMGIKTVAVYSDADRGAMHVRFADEAIHIGPPPSSESYLRMDKIIEAAKTTGADAIHPGYGFLSENEAFAQLAADAGIAFIGPSPQTISVMGNKLAAKAAVYKFNVPLVPGTKEPLVHVGEAKQIASTIGYPVLIKASAGGGGKGMRVVEREADMQEQMERATSEAKSAFGDGSVFLEKYITKPRHIEFQVLGDKHGNVVHLFERECSVQRRHQKVIEEAPSSILTADKRRAMGEAAVNVAKSCGYYNAGTVEFILDDQLNFYFLEMNTRLQVEHPVTEMITGLDLVRLQIRIAEGEPLPFAQEDLEIKGHAVEVRVYAEDPANNFLPDIGVLKTYVKPDGPGIRIDDGVEQGMQIPFYYDPMLAKLITYAENRDAAIARMIRAIDEYDITGLQTTLGFCKFVMQHHAFTSGDFDTKFVERYFTADVLTKPLSDDILTVGVALAGWLQDNKKVTAQSADESQKAVSKWRTSRLQ